MELQRSTPSKTLLNGIENSKPIPIDLVMEIISRLPVKSIGRCRCVSKLWASMLRLPYFTKLFTTRSSARPKILFVYMSAKGRFVFFSSPQPQNPDENSSSSVAANYLSRAPYGGPLCHISDPVHGFVCLTVKDNISTEHIIYNPSTGQALTLPKTRMVGVMSFLWYDSVYKKIKVFSMKGDSNHLRQHQVMTLGTQKLEWRKTKYYIPRRYYHKGICINGVLYYRAVHACTRASIIVCFDFRSEEFSFIEVGTIFKVPLICGQYINYNGKLGLLHSNWCDYASGASRSFELLVIGDFQKQEWSTHKYMLPPTWKNMVREVLSFVGFIGTNTIVLSHYSYVIYYNIEKNTIVKVGIQGLEGFKCSDVFTCLDFVEDLKLGVHPKILKDRYRVLLIASIFFYPL
ncbi:hypothetical protein Bca4012_017547 [Brassica carinata]